VTGETSLGKSRRGNKEYSREQKLVHENKRLKREIAQLRKQLARLDLDRYDSIKEMIEEHGHENTAQTGQELLENLKKTWACNKPKCQGHLEIIVYSKLGNPWYYRQCTNCPNRTIAQKYTPEVKGIIKKVAPDA
jgi:hypothetical protein